MIYHSFVSYGHPRSRDFSENDHLLHQPHRQCFINPKTLCFILTIQTPDICVHFFSFFAGREKCGFPSERPSFYRPSPFVLKCKTILILIQCTSSSLEHATGSGVLRLGLAARGCVPFCRTANTSTPSAPPHGTRPQRAPNPPTASVRKATDECSNMFAT